jgi:hypothetical protein
MRDLFRILHFDIRVIVVFMGHRPFQKVYSAILGDEDSYHRVRSALMRASAPKARAPSPDRDLCVERLLTSQVRAAPPPTIAKDDPLAFSRDQLTRMSNVKLPSAPQIVHHPTSSHSFVFFKREEESAPRKVVGDGVRLEVEAPERQFEQFESELLKDVADILSADPSSDGVPAATGEPEDNRELEWLPADNPFFAPSENYVTINHVRIASELCGLLGVPVIRAPEEAAAECARLERVGVVDAVASDDNNAVLFGSRWLIRGIFSRPQSVTVRSLEEVGVTRERMLMLAMMIDGDYNSDIRRRLFTVGPVRGMELIAYFPDPKTGLLAFREWWMRVVKGGCAEADPGLAALAKKKWLKRLILPADFPPADLMQAFLEPVVGEATPALPAIRIKEEELVKFVTGQCFMGEDRVREYCRDFAKRIATFRGRPRPLMRYKVNELRETPSFAGQFALLAKQDQRVSGPEADAQIARLLESDTESDSIASGNEG